MKTSNTETLIIRDNIGAETAFTIKATGKAFKILSDGLYTDKILAIIRELSCNAYDAHVAAKKLDIPFEVTLPSQLDPVFRIRDFGTGLDHQQVMHLYTSYFESTKTDSNDFIGALGLGSKSPFSYVDSFIVNSFFNGTKRLYTAFIAEQGVPSITLLGEEPTKESNGLEIIVPVEKREDYSSFTEKAKRVYQYFKVRPTLKNHEPFSYKNDEPVLEGSNWSLYKKEGWSNQTRVLQGNVAYPVKLDTFTGALSKEAYNYHSLFHSNFLIEFPIGDLEVAASREALSMDSRTQRNILDGVQSIKDELIAQLNKKFDEQPTKWAARILLNEIYTWTDYIGELSRGGNFFYKGEPLTASIEIKMKEHQDVRVLHWYSYGKNVRRIYKYVAPDPKEPSKQYQFDSTFDITPSENKNSTFWIDDVGHTMQSRIRSQRKGESAFVVSLDLPPTVNHRKQDEVQQYVKDHPSVTAFVEAFEGATFRYVSEIPKPVTTRYSTRRVGKFFTFSPSSMLVTPYYSKPGDLRQVRTDGLTSCVRSNWSEGEVEIKDLQKAPWMEIFKFIPTKYVNDLNKFGEIYALATHLKLIQDTTPVFGIRPKDNAKVKLPEANEFTAYIRRLCDEQINKRGIREKVRMNAEHSKVITTVGWDTINFYTKCDNSLPAIAKFKALWSKVRYTELSQEDKNLYDLGQLLALEHLTTHKESIEVIAAHREIAARYPLLAPILEHQKNHWNIKVDVTAIDNYIKAIDIAQPLAVA